MRKLLLSLVLVFVFSASAFAGCISGSCINGQGTYTYPNGDKYVGEWKNDKRNGLGTYTYGEGEWEGDQYVGEFKYGYFNGQGTYTYADGTIERGIWEDGMTKAEREAIEKARKKSDRIYNACLIDKSSGVDMKITDLKKTVEETRRQYLSEIENACWTIAEDPSWYEEWKYN